MAESSSSDEGGGRRVSIDLRRGELGGCDFSVGFDATFDAFGFVGLAGLVVVDGFERHLVGCEGAGVALG